jgi:hypothetical protein
MISNYILLLPFFLICVILFNTLAFASSPSFPRQLGLEPLREWTYFPLSEFSNCTGAARSVQVPQMTGASYFSDGNFLNATIWLSDTLNEKTVPFPSSLAYTMGIGIIQPYSTTAKVDYAVTVQWNPVTQTWIRSMEEFLAYGTRILELDNNYTDFENIEDKSYINLSLDLDRISSPTQYFITFLAVGMDISTRPFCGLIDNISHLFYVPPLDFSLSAFPNTLQIKPGEERIIELRANSNNPVKPLLHINIIEPQGLEISVSPNRTNNTAGGMTSSFVKVKAKDDTNPITNNIAISSNISFPIAFDTSEFVGEKESSIRGNKIPITEDLNRDEIKANGPNQSTSISSTNYTSSTDLPPSYFSVIVSPYPSEERFKDFWTTYGGVISLIGGGFAAGFSALIIDRVRKKEK